MCLQLEQNEACQYDAITVIDTNETQLHKLCGLNQENIEVWEFHDDGDDDDVDDDDDDTGRA